MKNKIILPELVCGIGQKLKVKNDIHYPDGLVIYANETCFVEDIIGYGFDIKTDKEKVDLRFMNSEILIYFELI